LAGGDRKSQTRRSKPSAVNTQKKNLNKLNREIASLRVKIDHLKKKRGISSDDDADDADGPQQNTGNQLDRKGKKRGKNE
jgi:hypothetical protein